MATATSGSKPIVGATSKLSAKKRKLILLSWLKDERCRSIESFCAHAKVDPSYLPFFRRATTDLDLNVIRRLRSELDGVDKLAESKVNQYCGLGNKHRGKGRGPRKPATNNNIHNNAELTRDLVLDWFAAEDLPSVAKFLAERGETKMKASVMRVIQQCGLHELRKRRHDPDARQLAINTVDRVLLAGRPMTTKSRKGNKVKPARKRQPRCAKKRSSKAAQSTKEHKYATPPVDKKEYTDDWLDISICSSMELD